MDQFPVKMYPGLSSALPAIVIVMIPEQVSTDRLELEDMVY